MLIEARQSALYQIASGERESKKKKLRSLSVRSAIQAIVLNDKKESEAWIFLLQKKKFPFLTHQFSLVLPKIV